MNWAAIEPVLSALLASLAADPNRDATGFECLWKDRANKTIQAAQAFQLEAKVVRVATIGADDKRTEFVPEDSEDPDDAAYLGQQRVTICGLRRVFLEIETTPIEHNADVSIMAPLDRIRTGLERQSSIDVLAAVEAAVSRVGDAFKASRVRNGRYHAKARMEIELDVAFADVDPTAQDWIETVLITSHVKGSDGTELPVPPNYVDDVVTIAE